MNVNTMCASGANIIIECRSVHIIIVDTITYIDIHLVTLILSYESVDVHAGFYKSPPPKEFCKQQVFL